MHLKFEKYRTGIIPVARAGIINLSYLAFISGHNCRKWQNGKKSALVYWKTINNLKEILSYILQISGQLIMLLRSFITASSFYQKMVGGIKLMYIVFTTPILVFQFFTGKKKSCHVHCLILLLFRSGFTLILGLSLTCD